MWLLMNNIDSHSIECAVYNVYQHSVLRLRSTDWKQSLKFKVTVAVATCNSTRAINRLQTTRVGVDGGTLPCVWLAHATSGESVTNNLTYLPSTTS